MKMKKRNKTRKIRKIRKIRKNEKVTKIIINNGKKEKEKSSILFWSSLVFVTNMIHAFIAGLYLYSLLFAGLTISSLVVHTKNNWLTNSIDKMMVVSIFLYGGYRMWTRRSTMFRSILLLTICFLTFSFCVWVYVYGCFTGQYCFSNNGDNWHATMHCVGSFGHHIIMLL
jgi:hypothetical protein